MSEQAQERIAPSSLESEEAVLGGILIAPEMLQEVDFISPGDFYLLRNGWVFEAMKAIQARGDALDEITLMNELKERKHGDTTRLHLAGGAAFITKLINNTPTFAHVETYARIVERCAIRRRLLDAAQTMADLALRSEDPVEDILAQSEVALSKVPSQKEHRDEDCKLATHIQVYYDEVALRHETNAAFGISTGFAEYDEMTNGFQKGEWTIPAGRPSMGKTGFLLHLAYNAAMQGNAALFLSNEMTVSALCNRLAAMQTKMDSRLIGKGKFEDIHWQRFNDGVSALSGLPFYLMFTPGLKPAQMNRIVSRLRRRYNIKIVFQDYVGLMRGDKGRYGNRVEEIGDISHRMKELAGTHDLPLISAAQLSRAMQDRTDKRPQLWDLRESGDLEQDADNVLFVHREDYYKASNQPGVVEMILAKQRNGPTGMFKLKFLKQYNWFESLG